MYLKNAAYAAEDLNAYEMYPRLDQNLNFSTDAPQIFIKSGFEGNRLDSNLGFFDTKSNISREVTGISENGFRLRVAPLKRHRIPSPRFRGNSTDCHTRQNYKNFSKPNADSCSRPPIATGDPFRAAQASDVRLSSYKIYFMNL
ncbi:hypothetical protein TNCT_117621 [Trichonephila clavata]|uniref:Uncharacterized protein n=1 Tax=Trichonephila clavata TaxID=2740835 RepID=A0A8X6G420_TRICU|nr:hypothetical protein TNCT_117621 [Trichonephila clavata]